MIIVKKSRHKYTDRKLKIMQETFLQKIAKEIVKFPDFTNKIIVLPNKRAGVFLKKALVDLLNKPIIAPQIISIDEFVEQYSPFQRADWLPLIFELFKAYKKVYADKAQSFDEFIKWGPYILQDFNEIDTFGIDANEVFTYINEVKKIEDWQLRPDSPKLITDYLKFYASLLDLYKAFQQNLQAQNFAYQGMIYNYVADHIEEIAKQFDKNSLMFVGFNSFNQSEERIVKHLIFEAVATTFWDVDKYYLKPQFEAGLFLRRYRKDFSPFNWTFDYFSTPKHIEIIGVPGLTAQAQVVAKMVDERLLNSVENIDENLLNTAIVLNEDSALLPMINALPDALQAVNITLGMPVGQLPVTQTFEQLIKLYYEYEQFNRYNVDTIAGLVHQPYLEQLFSKEEFDKNEAFLGIIAKFKTKMLSKKLLDELLEGRKGFIKKIFIDNFSIDRFLNLFFEIIAQFSQKNISEIDQLALVKLESIFETLQAFIKQTGEIKDIRTLQTLFKKLLMQERLAFEGEPLQGLQIMGILETRLLDFDHLIITSMNEGIIPKGKSSHSIIPFELKKHFGMPMHREQNSVIAYHFYRLLQRASKITLLYNTDDSGMGAAEQSRFITQLENELDTNIHTIVKKQLKLSTDIVNFEPESIAKTPEIIQKLTDIGKRGFSPSALTTYIKNPLKYYQRYILNLQEPDQIEEMIPANVFGTIIHDTMEEIYKNYEGKILSNDNFKQIMQSYEAISTKHFMSNVFGDEVKKSIAVEGYNLIAFEIIKKNVKDLLLIDQKLVKTGKRLQIVSVENKLTAAIKLQDRTLNISGKVDRIDKLDGVLRIIDYKTGMVEDANISIGGSRRKHEELGMIIEEPKKEKLFQLLTYAWLYVNTQKIYTDTYPFEVGILSTRNVKNGLMKAKIDKNTEITQEIIQEYEQYLVQLLTELFDADVDFVEVV